MQAGSLDAILVLLNPNNGVELSRSVSKEALQSRDKVMAAGKEAQVSQTTWDTSKHSCPEETMHFPQN